MRDLSIDARGIVNCLWLPFKKVQSNKSAGYRASVNYRFDTSWIADNACKNVADAFGPAVQELLKRVIDHPQFSKLAGVPAKHTMIN